MLLQEPPILGSGKRRRALGDIDDLGIELGGEGRGVGREVLHGGFHIISFSVEGDNNITDQRASARRLLDKLNEHLL